MLAAAAGLGDAVHRVHYDDYVADPAVLRGLFDWLGEDFDLAAVEAVMATPHSRRGQAPRGVSPLAQWASRVRRPVCGPAAASRDAPSADGSLADRPRQSLDHRAWA